MAELVAVGLAANILAFLEFGTKTALNFHAFYTAARDSADFLPDLNSITKDLSRCLSKLQDESLDKSTTGNASLLHLAQECQNTAQELETQLARLRSTKKGRIQATRTAWKAIWSENHIVRLQQRLEGFRSQFNIHLLTDLRHHAREAVAEQRKMFETIDARLDAIQQQHPSGTGLQDSSVSKPAALGDSAQGIGSLLLGRLEWGAHLQGQQLDKIDWEMRLIRAILHPTDDQPGTMVSEVELSDDRLKLCYQRFLQRLEYSQMDDRHMKIDEAYEETFRWIWEQDDGTDRQWSSFPDWLESPTSLYWVTGKAGSGKSTLMKFICQPSTARSLNRNRVSFGTGRCAEHLQRWAEDDRLVTAAFFFWNSGVKLQTNQEGLMRTLLSQILLQARDLIPHIAPSVWEALCLFDHDSLVERCSDTEVQQMFNRLLDILPADLRLCCFIDGLDEFQGDPTLIIELVKRMIGNPNIKLCVASRPWTAFEDAFHQNPGLMLEDLTKEDIKSFTTSRLMKEVAFRKYHQLQPLLTEKLINFVVKKASGVFLWVHLVVASLIIGTRDGDRLSDLEKRLESLPTELEDLFASMIASLKPEYLAHAAIIFELLRSQPDPPSVIVLSFADEESHYDVLKRSIKPLEEEEAALMYETLRRRLKSRTMGLLEVARPAGAELYGLGLSPAAVWLSSVQYLHRTVRDYLYKETVYTQFRKLLHPQFDLHLSMCVGQLCALKVMEDTLVRSATEFVSHQFFDCLHLFMLHASRVRKDAGKVVVRLMDDLDQSALTIIRRSLTNTNTVPAEIHNHLATGQWPKIYNYGAQNEAPPDLLTLACRIGVSPYVAARAPSKGRQSHALLCETMIGRLRPDLSYARATPDVRTISCLLGMNYTFSETLNNYSAWVYLLRGLAECQEAKDEAVWLQVAELAFRTGNRLPSKSSSELSFALNSEEENAAYSKLHNLQRPILESAQIARVGSKRAKLKRFLSKVR